MTKDSKDLGATVPLRRAGLAYDSLKLEEGQSDDKNGAENCSDDTGHDHGTFWSVLKIRASIQDRLN